VLFSAKWDRKKKKDVLDDIELPLSRSIEDGNNMDVKGELSGKHSWSGGSQCTNDFIEGVHDFTV
jgi:hypothetical protein